MSLAFQWWMPSSSVSIECADYQPTPGGRRCRHYIEGGGCQLPAHGECIEWRRRNRLAPRAAASVAVAAAGAAAAAATAPAQASLFAVTLPPPPAPSPGSDGRRSRSARQGAANAAPPAFATFDRPIDLRPEDITSFKALGVEVCIESPTLGEVWLVPEYTGADRQEITPEHAAKLAMIVQVFPGAHATEWLPLKAPAP